MRRAGSTVIGNAWAIHMQPDLYPQVRFVLRRQAIIEAHPPTARDIQA